MKNFCAIYDIMANIPELYSSENNQFSDNIGIIVDKIARKSAELRGILKGYYATLTVTPYLTYPISLGHNSDHNAFLKTPTILITTSTTKEADTYIIEFTDTDSFDVTNFLGESCGSGITSAEFTSSDGFFKIPTANWIGTFATGDKFAFAYETHEDILRTLGSYAVACDVLRGRYVSEAANSMQNLQVDYCIQAKTMIKQIVTGDIELECSLSTEGLLDSQEAWHGYNIDEYGIAQTPPESI